MMTVLSVSLVQVIVGIGFPSAEQCKVNSTGAITFRSLEMTMLLGEATKSNYSLHLTKDMLQYSHLYNHSVQRKSCPTARG